MKAIWAIPILMVAVACGPRSEQAGGRVVIQNKGYAPLRNIGCG